MPVPTPEQFAAMLDKAQAGDYALASINVTSSTTLNAALAAFAETKTDGIIQFSTGGSEFASGPIKDMAVGAIAMQLEFRMPYCAILARNPVQSI
jgi:fructose-bisphosphate aldolase class II